MRKKERKFKEVIGEEQIENLHEEAINFLEQGDYELAEKKLLEILRYDPVDISVFFDLAVVCEKQEKFNEAINYFKIVINFDPEEQKAYNNLAKIYFTLEDYDNADKMINEAKKISDDTTTFTISGAIFQAMENYEQAKNEYKKAIELDREKINKIARFNLATIYFDAGEYIECKRMLEEILEIDENDEQAKKNLEIVKDILSLYGLTNEKLN